MPQYQIGDLINFAYPAVHKEGTRAHDKSPQVLVLHPNWQGLLHGVNFNYLTDDQINTLRMVLDPMFEMKYRRSLERKNRSAYMELERIISAAPRNAQGLFSNPKITSPKIFYDTVMKPFIQNKDAYRLYRVDKMRGIKVVTPARTILGQDSYDKFRRQHSQAAREIEQLMARARTPQEKDAAAKALANFEQAKTPEQKQSVLQWFKNRFQHMRGPRI